MCLLGMYTRINAHLGYDCFCKLTLKVQKMKRSEFANNIDPDEVARHELPQLDLHCLPSSRNFECDIA